MKTCPRCNRSYPDSESFCADDRSALISAPAFTHQTGATTLECPVCGGKAEPGEIICNFCGARLDQPEALASAPQPAKVPTPPYPRLGAGVTQVHQQSSGSPVEGTEPAGGRSILGTAGYVVAAILALAAGAWLAIHLSNTKSADEAAEESSPASMTSPAPGAASPIVALADAMVIQVSGPGATSADRNAGALRKGFDDNRGSIIDAYNHALNGDPKVSDGMVVRLRIRPDGGVDNSAVRTSTSPNPSLDAEVARETLGWKFPATSAGEVEADYPIVFAHDGGEEAKIESDLEAKLASLSPTEPPEYASVPVAEATPPAAAPSTEAAAVAPSPPVVATPMAAASEEPKPRPRPRKVAAVPHPAAPSLFQQVQERLKSNPKLHRVKAYTTGGTVTLFGKVFDDSDKSLAEDTVRNIPGVTSVVNTIITDEAEYAEEQSRITQELANAGLDKVTVKVIGHDAFLNGEVKTELEKSRAVTVAEGAAPVTVRENLIRVEPGNMFGF